ncbi:coiled-coil domain-containing protein [Enterococcus timonensis]|uniref:coiled-coil domain-containing protein n=1 Tax=Enterococcus timonensis TaxID=1852364 RepID=UPI0008D962D5|nr:hypothetical protein [Enterococcus timonensis]
MKGKKLVILALCGIFLAGNFPVLLSADDLDDVKTQEAQVQQSNANLSQEIQNALTAVDTKTNEINELSATIDETNGNIATMEEQIQQSKLTIEKRRQVAEERLQAMQMEGSNSNSFELLLEATSFSDFISRAIVLSQMQQAENDKMTALNEETEKISGLLSDLETEQANLETQKADLESAKQNLDVQVGSLQDKYSANEEVLQQLAEKKQTIEDQRAKEAAEAAAKAAAEKEAQRQAELAQAAADKAAQQAADKAAQQAAQAAADKENEANNATPAPSTPEVSVPETPSTGGGSSSSAQISLGQFLTQGVVYANGYKFTYYSQSVLPGGGLSIPGRHVSSDGYVCDGDGYIVAAGSDAKGTVIPTPFGASAKIYDRGTTGNHIDIYIR